MKTFKKVLWIWIFVLAFSFLGCERDEFTACNCDDVPSGNIKLTGSINPYSLIKKGKSTPTLQSTDTLIKSKNDYIGFRLNYYTVIFPRIKNYKKTFSFLFPSVYADCLGEGFLFKDLYPISLKVYTLYSINDSISENSLVNKYLTIQGEDNFRINKNNIEIDTTFLLNEENKVHYPGFGLEFLIDSNLVTSNSLKFRIETKLSTGEILITETPLVKFEN